MIDDIEDTYTVPSSTAKTAADNESVIDDICRQACNPYFLETFYQPSSQFRNQDFPVMAGNSLLRQRWDRGYFRKSRSVLLLFDLWFQWIVCRRRILSSDRHEIQNIALSVSLQAVILNGQTGSSI
ncbi:hypothetical protein SH668x_000452 [Planctomicrobium sp. SH668]|uniref:hypothetical protein n=1 Tax=Planctomicrobium sp. SH668 TaxID=3448126 RepID=UPI003F5C66CE